MSPPNGRAHLVEEAGEKPLKGEVSSFLGRGVEAPRVRDTQTTRMQSRRWQVLCEGQEPVSSVRQRSAASRRMEGFPEGVQTLCLLVKDGGIWTSSGQTGSVNTQAEVSRLARRLKSESGHL